jgi:hypothetical protein
MSEDAIQSCRSSSRTANSIVKAHHQRQPIDLSLGHSLQRRMCLALVIVELHIVQI